jgi:hypothetical protein
MKFIFIVMVIGPITAIVLIGLGLLAAYSSIIARRSDAPSDIYPFGYQGWLSCVCGIWILFNGVLDLIALRVVWGSSGDNLLLNLAAVAGSARCRVGPSARVSWVRSAHQAGRAGAAD